MREEGKTKPGRATEANVERGSYAGIRIPNPVLFLQWLHLVCPGEDCDERKHPQDADQRFEITGVP
jgi:hypothetical protein